MRRLRAIYTEAHRQVWLDIALTLERRLGLEPCYWVGKASFATRVSAVFPSALFHARSDAIRGVPAPAFHAPLRASDTDVLRAFSRVLLAAGKMMDRLDPGDGFRADERMRLFQAQLRYWRAVLEHLKPDIVIFPVQPHTGYDYVLYELCQFSGIRTSMFQWTLFHDWIYPLDHIRTGYSGIRERCARMVADDADVDLPVRVEDYLTRVAGGYGDAIPDYLARQIPSSVKSDLMGSVSAADESDPVVRVETPARLSVPLPRFGELLKNPRRGRKHVRRYITNRRVRSARAWRRSTLRRATRRTIARLQRTLSVRGILRQVRVSRKATRRTYRRRARFIVEGLRRGRLDRPLKEAGRAMAESFHGRLGGWRLQRVRRAGARAKRRLLREYLERCEAPDWDRPFIFVALHYQPEQTTSPTGGVFVDQILMVDMLARSLPAGWYVYAKEHPYQFLPDSVGERGRAAGFYDDLLACPNVKLMSWSISPFQLIDRSRATATVTGTTGIEAIIRGKPVLVFGHAWYRDCDGVFYTPDNNTLRDAIERIAAGRRPDRRRVRCFLSAVEQSCFRADMDFGTVIEPPIPHEENVERLAAGIERILTASPSIRD